MNYKSNLVNNFVSRRIFIKLLPHMPRRIIQEFLGFEALSPIEQFATQGYNSRLYSELKIEKNETVLVLGGYLGASISEWRGLFDCEVVAFEPIPEYAKKLSLDFINDEKVLIQEFAVSAQEGVVDLGIEGEATGQYSNSRTKLKVRSKDINKVVNEIGDSLKLIEMNIEGGEYENLERLIQVGSISKVPTLLVQFHRYTLNEELRRAQIRIELEKTHSCVFEFPWVWERWDVRS